MARASEVFPSSKILRSLFSSSLVFRRFERTLVVLLTGETALALNPMDVIAWKKLLEFYLSRMLGE
jgi:hypothetical protein